jgi:hypothetical protein
MDGCRYTLPFLVEVSLENLYTKKKVVRFGWLGIHFFLLGRGQFRNSLCQEGSVSVVHVVILAKTHFFLSIFLFS